ncbi:T9SS type A sorting domain-containing protein [Hymenobacter terricola]|uniref:T9SS type A sorting domain-containing protein n=1 Tax=Hymenobacter terricola TaxID=2819236 RepID=UPI001B30A2CD|nr:T9SS type A sorting domain-containing protein [Hymenobacter terricola]
MNIWLRQSVLLILVFLAVPGRVNAQNIVTGQITSGGIPRHFIIYVPASYRPGTRVPLLLNIHAYGSNDGYQMRYGDFRFIADTANFIIVHPNGVLNSAGALMFSPLYPPATGEVDDVAFISSLIDTISTRYSIDPNRIYSTGMSNGGFMSYELACQLNGRIAAIASVAGAQNRLRQAGCQPVHPTPIMEIHGTADGAVPYAGDSNYASINSILNYWIQFNRCTSTPIRTAVPDIDPTDGCTAEHYVWNNGRNGSAVEHFRIIDGAHTWPSAPDLYGATNKDIDASVEIWRFLRRYNLQQLTKSENILPQPPSIWPNPVDDSNVLTLAVGAPIEPIDVQVFDALGRKVSVTGVSNPNGLSLDTHFWQHGLYLMQVKVNQIVYHQKLIK